MEILSLMKQLSEKYGKDNVWIADVVTEIMVG